MGGISAIISSCEKRTSSRFTSCSKRKDQNLWAERRSVSIVYVGQQIAANGTSHAAFQLKPVLHSFKAKQYGDFEDLTLQNVRTPPVPLSVPHQPGAFKVVCTPEIDIALASLNEAINELTVLVAIREGTLRRYQPSRGHKTTLSPETLFPSRVDDECL